MMLGQPREVFNPETKQFERNPVAEYERLLRLTLDMLNDVIEEDGGSGIPLWQIEELASDIGDALVDGVQLIDGGES